MTLNYYEGIIATPEVSLPLPPISRKAQPTYTPRGARPRRRIWDRSTVLGALTSFQVGVFGFLFGYGMFGFEMGFLGWLTGSSLGLVVGAMLGRP